MGVLDNTAKRNPAIPLRISKLLLAIEFHAQLSGAELSKLRTLKRSERLQFFHSDLTATILLEEGLDRFDVRHFYFSTPSYESGQCAP